MNDRASNCKFEIYFIANSGDYVTVLGLNETILGLNTIENFVELNLDVGKNFLIFFVYWCAYPPTPVTVYRLRASTW